jgi:hypothetical protein
MLYSAIELGAEFHGSKYAADVVIIPEMVLLVICEGCGEKVGDKESEIGADEATWIKKLLAASQN